MKIQCNGCERAEARVLCCADEAALCFDCDDKIHAANKLAGKHQRVPLSSSPFHFPKCDICQETTGYFFCLEDRALLCRKCDVAIHTANSFVSAHQRFLLTGVKVGLEATESSCLSSTKEKLKYVDKASETLSSQSISQTGAVAPYNVDKVSEMTSTQSISRRGAMVPCTVETNPVLPGQIGGVGTPLSTKVPFAGGFTPGSIPDWQLDEYMGMGLTDLSQNYGFVDNVSSRVSSSFPLQYCRARTMTMYHRDYTSVSR